MNNQEQDFMMNEMSYLANTLHRLFYRKRFPEFELSDTPVGVLRQIDGMVFSLLHEYEELTHKLRKVELEKANSVCEFRESTKKALELADLWDSGKALTLREYAQIANALTSELRMFIDERNNNNHSETAKNTRG